MHLTAFVAWCVGRYPSILRCAFNISDIFADLGCHKEAAATLSRVSSIEGDQFVAVAQTLAAEQFDKAEMFRKASFHRVLAANRFSAAGIHGLSFDCYRLALPSFDQKHWGVLDEHLAIRLLAEGEKAGQMTPKIAAECVRRLVAVCRKLSAPAQTDRLRKIVHVLDAYSSNEPVDLLVDIPRIDPGSVKACINSLGMDTISAQQVVISSFKSLVPELHKEFKHFLMNPNQKNSEVMNKLMTSAIQKPEQKSKIYAADERLTATVAQKPWPLLEFRALKTPHKWSYTDQAQRYVLEIENIGNEDVVSMCLATNAFDRVSAGNLSHLEEAADRSEIPLQLAANNQKIATFHFSEESPAIFLKVGEKRKVFVDIRSADEPTSTSSVMAKNPESTVLLIAYRSAGGQMRQWRRVMDGERRRLISVQAEVLGEFLMLFCLRDSKFPASNIQISCETASKEVSHDFSTSRICELPIRVRIRNTHPQRHRVSISLRHVAKVRDSVDGIHLVAPENRHQMWTDRPVSRRNFIKPDEWADVEMKWKVSHAAVYDVGGANLSVEAKFEGVDETVFYKVSGLFHLFFLIALIRSENSQLKRRHRIRLFVARPTPKKI
uniref:Uncharacterized protein n=1 Tax=Caenorhabditis japonica TaxID=281687 RepID=A0A8R1EHX6_CAEJA